MISYDRFRSGLTFECVRQELLAEQKSAKRSGLYMYVTRATVLGRWRQHKLSAYGHAERSSP